MSGPADISIEGERVLSTLNRDGTRRWLKPRPSPGRFLSARRAVAWFLILIFTLAPYLRYDGKPMFLLDLAARRFTLFGRTFLPTDTILLAFFIIGVFVTIFLLTALFGRVWCGWACPQTVYLEFVYRPIERLFEGTPGRTSKGLFRGSAAAKPIKFLVYLAVSMFLAHTFIAWFVGTERLFTWIRGSPAEHPVGFMVMAATTALMLFDFGFFREQTCIVACPYGRFQSVLLDRDSLIVTYDRKRGEPRGRAARPRSAHPAPADAPAPVGDCVDCGLCVTTCPTGIDIREGLQLECVGCAQCIDACDAVMAKLKRPLGLIRYSSQAAIEGQKRHLIRPRVIIYPVLLLLIGTAFFFALRAQGPAYVTILRGLGRPFTQLPGGEISNPVRIKIFNRTDNAVRYLVEVEDPGFRVASETDPIVIEGGKSATIAAAVIAPPGALDHGVRAVVLRVTDGAGLVVERKYRLVGPGSESEHHDHEDQPESHDDPAKPQEHKQ